MSEFRKQPSVNMTLSPWINQGALLLTPIPFPSLATAFFSYHPWEMTREIQILSGGHVSSLHFARSQRSVLTRMQWDK